MQVVYAQTHLLKIDELPGGGGQEPVTGGDQQQRLVEVGPEQGLNRPVQLAASFQDQRRISS